MRRRLLTDNSIEFSEKENSILDSLVLWYDPKRQGCTNENMQENPVLKDLSGNGYDATCYNFGSYPTDFNNWTFSDVATVTDKSSNKFTITSTTGTDTGVGTICSLTNTNIAFSIKVSGADGLNLTTQVIKGSDDIVETINIYSDGIYHINQNNLGENLTIRSTATRTSCNITIELLPNWGQSNTYPTDFTTWTSYNINATVSKEANKVTSTHTAFGEDTLSWIIEKHASIAEPEMYIRLSGLNRAATNISYRYYNGTELIFQKLYVGINKLPASVANVDDNSYIGFVNVNGEVGDTATIELLPNPSGIGGYYPEDFSRLSTSSTSNAQTTIQSSTKIVSTFTYNPENTNSVIAYFMDTAPEYRVKVTIKSNNPDASISYLGYDGSKSYQKNLSNGIYTIPASSTSTENPGTGWLGFYCYQGLSTGDIVIIEQLPMYDGGLVFDRDSINYCKAENIPLLEDFTVIVKRELFDEDFGCTLNKGDTLYGGNNTITFEGMESDIGGFPCLYSFAAVTQIDLSKDKLVYMTKTSYNGIDISGGSTPDNSPNIYLGTFREGDTRYLQGTIYSILLFNRTLTLSEINWVIQNLMWETSNKTSK